jgi:branched-chain amino acid transport system ATP-binding protein
MKQASGEALLRVDHVSVRFGGLTAVDNVSFEVHEGELLGLIGPNGAGKTTMLRAITGVVTASAGNVYLRALC